MVSEQTRDILRASWGQEILSDHFTWLQVEPARSSQPSLELLSNLSAFYNMQSSVQKLRTQLLAANTGLTFWNIFQAGGVILQVYGCLVFYLLKWTCEG